MTQPAASGPDQFDPATFTVVVSRSSFHHRVEKLRDPPHVRTLF